MNQPLPLESRSPSRLRALRPYVLGAIFIWSLIGAVAVAAFSSREVPSVATAPRPDASQSDATLALAAPAGKGGQKIAWQSDFESAMRRARQENKPLMIEFYSDSCSLCKILDRKVLPDKTLVTASRAFVAIKINADKRPDVAGAYGISGYPTMVFAAHSGQPLKILAGLATADEFVGAMQAAQAKL